MRLLTGVALSLIGVAGMANAQGKGTEDVRAAVLEADREFGRQTAARGLAGWVDALADEVAIFLPGEPIVQGLAAVKACYARTGFDPRDLRWTPLAADVAASGDLAYTWGTWEVRVAGAAGAAGVRTGKYCTVWRKQPDGRWKVVADIGNADPPAKPAAP